MVLPPLGGFPFMVSSSIKALPASVQKISLPL
jgi:hypothetical protein